MRGSNLPHHDFFFSIYIKFLKKIHPFLICKSPYSLGLWYFYHSIQTIRKNSEVLLHRNYQGGVKKYWHCEYIKLATENSSQIPKMMMTSPAANCKTCLVDPIPTNLEN
jgi:hypothetical protein